MEKKMDDLTCGVDFQNGGQLSSHRKLKTSHPPYHRTTLVLT